MEPTRTSDPVEAKPGIGEHARMSGDESQGFELAERHESSLLSLFELSHELGVLLDPYQIAQLTLFNLMGHFATPKAALWVLPESGPRDAVLLRSYGLREELVRALGAGLAVQVADEFASMRLPILLSEWEAGHAPAELALEGGLAVVAPVAAHGRLIGLLALGARVSGEPYLPIDREHLGAAAGMVGVALENTRIYHGMLEANRKLREMNEHLEESDRLRSEFIDNINHELKTPVAVLVGYLTTVVDSWELNETQHKTVDRLTFQCNRLGGLMQNLLDYSAFQRKATELVMIEGNVGPLLRDHAESRRPGLLQGPRELVIEIGPNLPRVRFDARRLIQVVDALVDNAVKFTSPGTRIHVRAIADTTRVRIEVEDNGPGIPHEHLATLFEPFRQVDGSATRAVGGLGLGLALVRQIAEQMGATLEVHSEVGSGTTFGLLLGAATAA